ncbi:hypothetical protein BT63DRAFT_477356 [Microthyrium microscopicum]|uniref:peptidylprolyl isomerase n=1 Tax=Microthyrium microscopicum TaxID=703497 RepID=A0A6A6UH34_9PEZI|nr:hypothetical protein BT63DRAFT_477356 [Microthyrium microscopicum]
MRGFISSSASLTLVLLATLLNVSHAQILDNGLKVETTKPASCMRKSKAGDQLKVHYRGTLQSDGSEFDSSYGRGTPFGFTLGVGQVIKGWDQGMADMCPGEGRKLTIPPALGYGSSDMGKIPPNSVLIFETELLAIEGVEKETPPPIVSDAGTPDGSHDVNIALTGNKDGPKKEHAECKLLGQFAILIQAALGGLALLSLVWKRWREKPRRPVLVWFFDVSKQVVGSFMLHFANLFLSMLSSGNLNITTKSTDIENLAKHGRESPNPCSFYLLNLAIDTTIGIPILVVFLRILHWLVAKTPLANPPESLKSGVYGHPPSWRWWGKQALIYFLGLLAMKIVVFLLFQLFPWLGWVGDWALRWTEGREWMQIVFVMLVFPLIMNVLQYWIIDSFIKDPAGDYEGYGAVGSEEDETGSEGEGLIGGRGRDSEDGSGPVRRISPQGGKVVARTKEANPLPMPQEFEDDDERPHRD